MRTQIKIAYRAGVADCDDIYRVVSVKNTTAFLPSEELDKSEVDDLCRSPAWDVTLVPLMEESAR